METFSEGDFLSASLSCTLREYQKHSIVPLHHFSEKCLRLPSGLRSRQFRWFLISMGLTSRDANTSLHNHEQAPENYLFEKYPVSDLAARIFANFSSSRSYVVRRVSLNPIRIKIHHHDCVTRLQTRFVFLIQNLMIRRERITNFCGLSVRSPPASGWFRHGARAVFVSLQI